MIVIPRRGKGRPSAAGAAAYREQVEEFCRQIKQIRGTLDFEVSARGWCYILEEHGATKADFDTIQNLPISKHAEKLPEARRLDKPKKPKASAVPSDFLSSLMSHQNSDLISSLMDEIVKIDGNARQPKP